MIHSVSVVQILIHWVGAEAEVCLWILETFQALEAFGQVDLWVVSILQDFLREYKYATDLFKPLMFRNDLRTCFIWIEEQLFTDFSHFYCRPLFEIC